MVAAAAAGRAATWVLVHESGVHATVAGVLLGFTIPIVSRAQGPGPGLAEHFEHRWRPISAGVAVTICLVLGVENLGEGGLRFSLAGPPGASVACSGRGQESPGPWRPLPRCMPCLQTTRASVYVVLVEQPFDAA